MNQSVETYEWFYRTEYLFTKFVWFMLLSDRYWIVFMKKVYGNKIQFQIYQYIFIFRDFKSVLRITIWIISLIIASLNFNPLSYLHRHIIKDLPSHTFSAFGISYLNSLTRSCDWIFNTMRYTGNICLGYLFLLCSAVLCWWFWI